MTAVATAKAAAPEPRPAAPPADFYETSGPLVVEDQVDVAAQREGVVGRIVADVGAHVRKRQLLAELDNRQLQADRAAADARVKSLQFELEHWQSETKMRESDLARDEEMWRANLITAKQVEHSRYAVAGARFETERERQSLRNAQETLRSLELELEKTRVAAPFDGVVARRYVRVGQKVALNDRLFWVTAMTPILLRFTVPQEFAGRLKAGEEVAIVSPAMPQQQHAARIKLVSPVVDPSSGTLEVQAQLIGNPPDLLPGMSVTIRVPKSR